MKTAIEFEKAIDQFIFEGKLDNTFRIIQYNEGWIVGKDDNGMNVVWDNNGEAWLYDNHAEICKCVVWNEEMESLELADGLRFSTNHPELKIE